MRQFCILVLTLFLSLQLWGQESRTVDKITLKTGEIYIGEIVVKTPDMVMLKAKSGTRYQFQLTEIKSIEKTVNTDSSNTQSANSPTPTAGEGNFSGQLDVSGGIMSAQNIFTTLPNTQVSLAFGNKKVLGKDIFVGVGVGYNVTFIPSGTIGLIPVFLRIQSILNKEKTAPYISMDAGYSFSSGTDIGGGTLAKISIGIVHRLNYKISLIAGIYGSLNSISGNQIDQNGYSYYGNTTMQSLGVKLGLQF